MKYFKKIVGKKIYLSPMSQQDVELYAKWMNDFFVTDYTGRSDRTLSLAAEEEWVKERSKDGNCFAIVCLENDQLIGNCSIMEIHSTNRTGTLGIFIGEKENWNKGYGTEAVKLLLDYAFSYLNINNIKLDLMEFNERAYRCYEKCGFQEIGRRRKSQFINGKYYDRIEMDILAEEFTEQAIQNKNI